ncbi:MAG TPA: hypothetical protein DGT21_03390 [Armatimonadetes bacterium]|jgi:hypothetical protein|nr:hypothetical protein [Armatimonadota bacterium]
MKELAGQLEADLTWREAEMAALKLEIVEARDHSVSQAVLLRAAVTLLYAHYEGFCRFAWDFYLNAIARLALARRHGRRELVSLSLVPQFHTLKHNTDPHGMAMYCLDELQAQLGAPLAFEPADKLLPTESNLWPTVLCENCDRAALPHQIADQHRQVLALLVTRRNEIAHGRNVPIRDLSEYETFENAVTLVMHDLAVAIIDSLDRGLYLAQDTERPHTRRRGSVPRRLARPRVPPSS